MTAAEALAELRQQLDEISDEAVRSVGVDLLEPMLELTDLLASGRVDRSAAVDELRRLASEWPPWAIEVLEFSMHRLRWDDLRRVLEDHRRSGADFRTRNLAQQALDAYVDDWPEGAIYRTYRSPRTS